MSALTTDLDDVDGLLAADRDGLLRAAAMAGAGVRAVSQAQSEGVLASLADLRPRAVVVVTGASATARRAAELVIATIAPRIDVPLMSVPVLPGWIGPLDVVVIAGDDAGDRALTDAATRALRRRAELAVLAPLEGPLLEATSGQPIIDLSPRLHVDPRFGYSRLVAALTAVCSGLSGVRLTPAVPDLAQVADTLDEEAAADHPGQESFHNQAKLLAMRVEGRTAVWTGDTPGTVALAHHAAAVAFSVAGVVTQAATEATLTGRLREGIGTRRSGANDDLFYDPDFDEPKSNGFRGILLTTAARRWYAERRVAAYGDIDVVAELPASDAGPELGDPYGAGDQDTDSPVDLAAYLVLALRAELAAVFIRLMGEAA